MFADGVTWTGDYESHPAFTPDGRTLDIASYLSPDGKYVFFSSARKDGEFPPGQRPSRSRNGLGDVDQMDLSVLHQLAK